MKNFIVHTSSKLVIVMVNLGVSTLNEGLHASPKHKHKETVVEPESDRIPFSVKVMGMEVEKSVSFEGGSRSKPSAGSG